MRGISKKLKPRVLWVAIAEGILGVGEEVDGEILHSYWPT
jgi:hypothetical protein